MTIQETTVETETETETETEINEAVEEDTSVYLADLPLTPPARPTRSVGTLTTGLLVLVVAGLGFLGGVKVQQHQGGATAGGAAAGFAARLGQQRAGGAGAPG
ncbi:MAG: hypothetical protein JWO68_154, partial [Actinomycetia bacterium]|nr:hypothetical protein [Actinomycetes bacterium]